MPVLPHLALLGTPTSSWLGTPCAARGGFRLTAVLGPQPSKGWYCGCVPPSPALRDKTIFKVLFVLFHFCGTRDWTWGFVCTRQVHYHWVTCPTITWMSLKKRRQTIENIYWFLFVWTSKAKRNHICLDAQFNVKTVRRNKRLNSIIAGVVVGASQNWNVLSSE